MLALAIAGCASPRAWVVERFPGGAVIGTSAGRSSRFQEGAAEAERELTRRIEERVFDVCGTKQFHELTSTSQRRSRELRIGCGFRSSDESVGPPAPGNTRGPLRQGGAPVAGSNCTAQQLDEMKRGGLSQSAIDRACSP